MMCLNMKFQVANFIKYITQKMAPIQRGEGQREERGVTGKYGEGKANNVGSEENSTSRGKKECHGLLRNIRGR